MCSYSNADAVVVKGIGFAHFWQEIYCLRSLSYAKKLVKDWILSPFFIFCIQFTGCLLLVEVKARSRVGPDGWGAGAFGIMKRKKLERSFSCWLALHQSWHQASVEIVLALVPIVSLPSQRLQKPIRWLIWHG